MTWQIKVQVRVVASWLFRLLGVLHREGIAVHANASIALALSAYP